MVNFVNEFINPSPLLLCWIELEVQLWRDPQLQSIPKQRLEVSRAFVEHFNRAALPPLRHSAHVDGSILEVGARAYIRDRCEAAFRKRNFSN